MRLLIWSLAWMAGIVVEAALRPPWGVTCGAASALLGGIWLWRRPAHQRWWGVAGLLFALGVWRCHLAWPRLDEGQVAWYNDRGEVTLVGVVAQEPEVRDADVRLYVQAEELVLAGGESHRVHGWVLVRLPRYPAYAYGDLLELRGRLETPPVLEGFDYRAYLARRGVFAWMPRATAQQLDTGYGNPLMTRLLAFKAHVQALITELLPEPHAALLTGILLGVEGAIPADLMEDFNTTGTTHILAISGFNISLIAGVLGGLCSRLFGRRAATPVAIGGIAVYTVLVGASAAVVRAAVMGSLALVARHANRRADAAAMLCFSGALMTTVQPFLLWDVGFQLSFTATLGLILFTDPLGRQLRKLLSRCLPEAWVEPAMGVLEEGLVVTSAAQIATLPLIVYVFGRLSLVSLLTNVLILPAQPGVMLWGGLATLVGLIWPAGGRVLGWIAWLFLSYTVSLVRWTARLPYASLDITIPLAWPVLGYYALLIGALIVLQIPSSARQRLRERIGQIVTSGAWVGVLAFSTVLVWAGVSMLPDGRLHLFVFDVGQGDAMLLVTPTGRQIVIDGGPSPAAMASALGQAMPFWDRSVDLVILTHPHEDHVNGLVPVLERYHVGVWMDPALPGATPAYSQCLSLVSEREIPVVRAREGVRIRSGDGVEIEVLYPPDPFSGERDVNEASVVLRVVYRQAVFLLMGDLEEEGESELLERRIPLQATLLKVGHHGGATSSGEAFLEAVRPQVALISVGLGNRFGHPSEEILDRLERVGAEIFRTDRDGTIEVITDGAQLWVHTSPRHGVYPQAEAP